MTRKTSTEPKQHRGEIRRYKAFGPGWHVLSVYVDGRWVHVHFDPTKAELVPMSVDNKFYETYHAVADVVAYRAAKPRKVKA